MFACSHDWFTDLGSQCSHQPHPSFAGLQDASGAYLSRLTAEYPPELAQAITSRVSSRIGPQIPQLSLPSALSMIPVISLCMTLHMHCTMVVGWAVNQIGVRLPTWPTP